MIAPSDWIPLAAVGGMFTAFGFLKEAILRGEPFATQLSQMYPLVQDDAKTKSLLDQLKPYAGGPCNSGQERGAGAGNR